MNLILSVVIPAYNYAQTIERAVYSVLNQITNEVELIVVNDGSTDNTKKILDQIKQSAKDKINVYHKENGGLASVRNYGIARGNGEYFVFLDADDELAPGAIAAILTFIKQHPTVSFVIGGHQSVLPNNVIKNHIPKPLPVSAYERVKRYLIDKKISLSNGACVMHRSIFDDIKYPEHFRNTEDIPVFTYALATCECATMPNILAKIYKHDDSLRHHLAISESVGAQLIEEVFNPLLIPSIFFRLKKHYAAQRYLSLSRVAYDAQNYQKCRRYFLSAFLIKWRVIFNFSYTKKIIKSFFKSIR